MQSNVAAPRVLKGSKYRKIEIKFLITVNVIHISFMFHKRYDWNWKAFEIKLKIFRAEPGWTRNPFIRRNLNWEHFYEALKIEIHLLYIFLSVLLYYT